MMHLLIFSVKLDKYISFRLGFFFFFLDWEKSEQGSEHTLEIVEELQFPFHVNERFPQ